MNPEAIKAFVKSFTDQGYKPVQWYFKDKPEGCRSCKSNENGPWFSAILPTMLDDETTKEVLFVIATLCAKCIKNEDLCNKVADRAVSEYLAFKNRHQN